MAPLPPDQVVVCLAFSVRNASVTEAALKFSPASAFVVALLPARQLDAFTVEHIAPPFQFSSVVKLRTPGAEPPRIPAVKFTVLVEITVVPMPKSMVAPAKFTVPVPVIGPVCRNKPPLKESAPLPVAVYIPGHPDPHDPPPENVN